MSGGRWGKFVGVEPGITKWFLYSSVLVTKRPNHQGWEPPRRSEGWGGGGGVPWPLSACVMTNKAIARRNRRPKVDMPARNRLVSLKMRFEVDLCSRKLSKFGVKKQPGVGADMVISNLTGYKGVHPRYHVDITLIRAQSYDMGAQHPRCNLLQACS